MRGAATAITGVLLCAVCLAGFWQLRQQLSPQPDKPAFATILSTPFLSVTPPPAFSPLPPQKTSPTADSAPKIAIIIDDLGNQRESDLRALNLHRDITLAILPFSVHGKKLAEMALQEGKEIMLHAPMEPISHLAGRDGLRRTMTETQLRQSLQAMLDSLPPVKGVNNHMGSALTQEQAPMDLVMEELSRRHLYFIDSRTSPRSVALKSARRHSVPSDRRDVFLDHQRDKKSIEREFQRLVQLAHKRGHAIAIGHPYPETLGFLESALPELEQMGVRLVTTSQLLQTEAYAKALTPDTESARQRPQASPKSI